MSRLTRRTALKLAGVGVVAPVATGAATAGERLEPLVEIPDEWTPENIAIDEDGRLYVGITQGEVWRFEPEQTLETGLALEDGEQRAAVPGEVLGVDVGPDGTLYAAVHAAEDTGLWRLTPDEGPTVLATVGPEAGFPNGVRYDRDFDRVLVTESFAGAVYEVPVDAEAEDRTSAPWVDDERLETPEFGANGIAVGPEGDVFVAVTRAVGEDGGATLTSSTEADEGGGLGADVGRIVRIAIAEDGAPGAVETHAEGPALLGADGLAFDGDECYVAANLRDRVIRVSPDGEATAVASSEDGLVMPSDVATGTIPEQEGRLFVCNFAPEAPAEGAVFRLEL